MGAHLSLQESQGGQARQDKHRQSGMEVYSHDSEQCGLIEHRNHEAQQPLLSQFSPTYLLPWLGANKLIDLMKVCLLKILTLCLKLFF